MQIGTFRIPRYQTGEISQSDNRKLDASALMTAIRKRQLQRVGIILIALPALVWFPWGFSLVIVSGEQLLFGFDDFPLGPVLLSLGFGVVVAVVALVIVCRGVWRGVLRLPLIITAAAAIFGIVSVPVARLMTKLEQDRRYRQHAPNQGAAANRRPAEQLDSLNNLSATLAADPAFPAAVAELDR